jgi:OmpA-OmpF porin, OOP family
MKLRALILLIYVGVLEFGTPAHCQITARFVQSSQNQRVGENLGVSQIQPPVKKPQPTVFSIRAVDETTQAALPAQFSVKAVLAKKEFAGKSQAGQTFDVTLNRTDTIVVITKVKGYYETEETLLISCDTCFTYEHVAVMEKADSLFRDLELNKAFRLDNVYFDQSSYVLRDESYSQLDKLVRTLQATPGLNIEIAGHTDNVGDRRLNQSLSENRAKIITNYLTRNGISEARLRYTGYGDKRPAAANDSEENKRKNRRVEFVVTKL